MLTFTFSHATYTHKNPNFHRYPLHTHTITTICYHLPFSECVKHFFVHTSSIPSGKESILVNIWPHLNLLLTCSQFRCFKMPKFAYRKCFFLPSLPTLYLLLRLALSLSLPQIACILHQTIIWSIMYKTPPWLCGKILFYFFIFLNIFISFINALFPQTSIQLFSFQLIRIFKSNR